MVLKAARSIPAFLNWYSGVSRYKSNTRCHSAAFNGGNVPMSGRHSTIDRPDSVRRVIAPIMAIANTIAAEKNSQFERIFLCFIDLNQCLP